MQNTNSWPQPRIATSYELVASASQFELGLTLMFEGDERQFETDWPENPYDVLEVIFEGGELPATGDERKISNPGLHTRRAQFQRGGDQLILCRQRERCR